MGRAVNARWLRIATVALMLAGCQLNHEAEADPTDPVEYPADQPFTLHGGQEATISGQSMTMRFDDVLEDSRCPTEVECFWTGQARIIASVRQHDADATTVEFNTNPAPSQTRTSVPVGAYTIELQSLEPYPFTPDESIAFEDYAATLVVRTP
jgi:hypothetical protein